jgi:hypothetical protein
VATAWIRGTGARRAIAQGAIALGVALAVITPWTIRNALVMHAPILISTNMGDDLCYGHSPEATGAFLQTGWCETPPARTRAEWEVRHNKWNTKEAWTYATHHPRREVELLGEKAKYTFAYGDSDGLLVVESYGSDQFIDKGFRNTLVVIANTWYYTMAALALFGLSAFLRGDPRRLMVLLSIVALLISPMIFIGGDRYHVPVLPLVALIAAVPVTWLISRLTPK